MLASRFRTAALIIGAAIGLGACTGYDNGYGYGGMSVGYGAPYYDNGYYGGGYGGWYDNFYYPGSGYYVFDRGGKRHRWNDRQRRYWEDRRGDRREFRQERREDRRDFRRGTVTRPEFRRDRREDRREFRQERREDRRDFRRGNREGRPPSAAPPRVGRDRPAPQARPRMERPDRTLGRPGRRNQER